MTVISLLLLSVLWTYIGQAYGIVNGTEASPHSRPYMVSVQKDGEHICNGFLVSRHFVMTAANCYIYGENLTVLLGAHDLSMTKCCATRMAVKYYHTHPAFQGVEGNIMLLQLNEAVKDSPSIKGIDIMMTNEDIKAGSICSVAGWGRTTTSGSLSNRLMEVAISVLDRCACTRAWGNKFSVSEMLCTGGDGGICKGDMGGPLVCKQKAVGFASFYAKGNCDQPLGPNVYTKISKFLLWIKPILDSLK